MSGRVYRAGDLLKFKDIDTDVCVIGSGAGGAVVAKEIAENLKRVIVLEEGGHYTARDFPREPHLAMQMLYQQGGNRAAMGNVIFPLPGGRCVGGTTVINSGICFRLPEDVFSRWLADDRIEGLDYAQMSSYYDRVERILGVAEADAGVAGENNRLADEAARAVGLQGQWLRRNAPACRGCGACNYGCPSGAKQSMERTYVPLAMHFGAHVFSNARVDKILFEGDTAVGVEATILQAAGHSEAEAGKLRIRARRVVVCGGAIGTPMLLQRSGVEVPSQAIGQNLHVHPQVGVIAEMDRDVLPWAGIPQAFAVHVGAHTMLQTYWLSPEIAATQLPDLGVAGKDAMRRIGRMAMCAAMISDTSSGSVSFDKDAPYTPKIGYEMNAADAAAIAHGVRETARMYFAMGAQRVITGVHSWGVLRSADELARCDPAQVRPQELTLYASHPMGTCRMHADSEIGVVDSRFRPFGTENLYVADASIFPTSLGVNPQMTVMAFATHAAGVLMESFRG